MRILSFISEGLFCGTVRWCGVVLGMIACTVGVSAAPGPGGSGADSEPAEGSTVRVMSYNVRYGSADDGPDRWSERRHRVIGTISRLSPVVLGLQEVEAFQLAELLDGLPGYASAGVFRRDGRLSGEASPVLFDRGRYSLIEAETFWLSDTPELPGSNTWGASNIRICTRVVLLDLRTGHELDVFNTHFDHRSQHARLKGAELIRARLPEPHSGRTVVVMGDLNANEENPAVRLLLDPGGPLPLRNAYRAVHPDALGGTFNGFDPGSEGGRAMIDYVLVGPGARVLDAGIDRARIDARHPSDHFPVWADLALPEP